MKNIINSIIIIILLLAVALLGVKYYLDQKQLDLNQKTISACNLNKKIANFNKLFVSNVLQTKGEVSYEDRLKLENAAMETQDKEMIDGWHDFLDSKTEAQAQENTKKLLNMGANKIVY